MMLFSHVSGRKEVHLISQEIEGITKDLRAHLFSPRSGHFWPKTLEKRKKNVSFSSILGLGWPLQSVASISEAPFRSF